MTVPVRSLIMPKNEGPAALAGADRAGNRVAGQALTTTTAQDAPAMTGSRSSTVSIGALEVGTVPGRFSAITLPQDEVVTSADRVAALDIMSVEMTQ